MAYILFYMKYSRSWPELANLITYIIHLEVVLLWFIKKKNEFCMYVCIIIDVDHSHFICGRNTISEKVTYTLSITLYIYRVNFFLSPHGDSFLFLVKDVKTGKTSSFIIVAKSKKARTCMYSKESRCSVHDYGLFEY